MLGLCECSREERACVEVNNQQTWVKCGMAGAHLALGVKTNVLETLNCSGAKDESAAPTGRGAGDVQVMS